MPNPGAAVKRLKGWRGATVITDSTVRPKRLAEKTGSVVALSACVPACAMPARHDEIGVELGAKTYWFTPSELHRQVSVIGPESPVRRSKARQRRKAVA